MRINDLISQKKEEKPNPELERVHALIFNPFLGTYKETREREIEKLEMLAQVVKDTIWLPLIDSFLSFFSELKSHENNPHPESCNYHDRTNPFLDQNLDTKVHYMYGGTFQAYSQIFRRLSLSGVFGHRPDFRLPLEEIKRYHGFELLKRCAHLQRFYDVISGLEEEVKEEKQEDGASK